MANLWKPLRRALLPMAVLGFAACQGEQGPVNLEDSAPSFVEVNGVKLVTMRPGGLQIADGVVQRVPGKSGATIETSDAKLVIQPGSVSDPNATITMQALNDGFVTFKFGPSGLSFSPAATLTISAAKANTVGIDLSQLRIAGASDGADDWSVVGGTYDSATNTVTVPISHFSRYALCVD
jgi:hypothetical protein